MPQINIYTYLSQTSWTIILFIIYYINMKQILIPLLLENIKLKNFNFNKKSKSNIQNNQNQYFNI